MRAFQLLFSGAEPSTRVWHAHEDTDELFLVVEGELTIELRDMKVDLKAGEMFVVPKGVEDCQKTVKEYPTI